MKYIVTWCTNGCVKTTTDEYHWGEFEAKFEFTEYDRALDFIFNLIDAMPNKKVKVEIVKEAA